MTSRRAVPTIHSALHLRGWRPRNLPTNNKIIIPLPNHFDNKFDRHPFSLSSFSVRGLDSIHDHCLKLGNSISNYGTSAVNMAENKWKTEKERLSKLSEDEWAKKRSQMAGVKLLDDVESWTDYLNYMIKRERQRLDRKR